MSFARLGVSGSPAHPPVLFQERPSRSLCHGREGCARLLIDRRNATEPEAYRMLQKTAMDQKLRLVEVAQRVIEMKELL